jgi:hypothetical protein
MKKLFLIVLAGLVCANSYVILADHYKALENVKRIDKNFIIVKSVLDAQAKEIVKLQPEKTPAPEKQEAPDAQVVAPK